MRGPDATAIDTQANGRPRLAFSEPSTGSITTRTDPAVAPPSATPRRAPPRPPTSGTPERLELGEDRVLGRLVDGQRHVAALALPLGTDRSAVLASAAHGRRAPACGRAAAEAPSQSASGSGIRGVS